MWNILRNFLALLGIAGIGKAIYDKGVEDGKITTTEKKTTTNKKR